MSFYFRIFLSATMTFLVLIFFGAQRSIAETYRVYGIVSSDVLWIRTGPSSKNRKIGSIPPYGKGVEKLGPCKGSWCKVSYHGMTGWSSMKYLTREGSMGSSFRVRGIKSWDVLFIRSRPSAKSKKVGSIPPDGRGVNKLGPCKGNWCKVSYRGITGWSSMMYLVADRSFRPAPEPYEEPLYQKPPERDNSHQSGGWGGEVPQNEEPAPPRAPPPSADMMDGL